MTNPTPSSKQKPDNRLQARRVFYITLSYNLLVALSKLIWGTLSHSLAMVADGFHSLLDTASNVVGILGINAAVKPADANHPYGHRKFETLAAMLISLMIFSTSLKILSDLVQRLLHPELHESVEVTPISYIVMGVTIALNIAVTVYETRKGKEYNNELLLADAAETRSDIFASALVILSLISAQLGLPGVDMVAALIVVCMIIITGYHIIRTHLSVLMDEAVLPDSLIKPVVLEVQGVLDCHQIRSRGMRDHVFVDLHIQVNPEISLREAHQIAHAVEDRLKAVFNGSVDNVCIGDVLVHVEEEGDMDDLTISESQPIA